MNKLSDSYRNYFRWEETSHQNATTAPVYFSYSDDCKDTPALLLSDSEDDLSLGECQHKPATALHEENRGPYENNRHVRFQSAKIRDYNVTVGDHPSCCDCLPLSLDWDHGEEHIYDIDAYETMRETDGRSKRGQLERLDYWEKRRILEDSLNHLDTSLSDDYYSKQDEARPVVSHCDPLSVFEGASWGMCSAGGCGGYNYPSMTVEVIDD